MGACTSAPRADFTNEPKRGHKLNRKSKATAHIRVDAPGEAQVSTPEAVYLTNQPSWSQHDGHISTANKDGEPYSSNSFTIKTEGMPSSCL